MWVLLFWDWTHARRRPSPFTPNCQLTQPTNPTPPPKKTAAPFGAILSVKVLCDGDSGACRGVGFVNFAEHEAAVAAMQTLHGTKARPFAAGEALGLVAAAGWGLLGEIEPAVPDATGRNRQPKSNTTPHTDPRQAAPRQPADPPHPRRARLRQLPAAPSQTPPTTHQHHRSRQLLSHHTAPLSCRVTTIHITHCEPTITDIQHTCEQPGG
jgi:hypothetical protein